jgi:hypothetical protein
MQLFIAATGLICFVDLGFAQLKTEVRQQPEDPIADELRKAMKDYQEALTNATSTMLDAFSTEEKKLANNNTRTAKEKIERIDFLQIERKAFEESGRLPSSSGMKIPVNDYQTTMQKAIAKCEKAFDTAANKYLKTDIKAAKDVLERKKTFFSSAIALLPNDERNYWNYEQGGSANGHFEMNKEHTWTEFDKDGKAIKKWDELVRTKDYIEIIEKEGNTILRLGSGKSWTVDAKDKTVTPSHGGGWRKTKDIIIVAPGVPDEKQSDTRKHWVFDKEQGYFEMQKD